MFFKYFYIILYESNEEHNVVLYKLEDQWYLMDFTVIAQLYKQFGDGIPFAKGFKLVLTEVLNSSSPTPIMAMAYYF